MRTIARACCLQLLHFGNVPCRFLRFYYFHVVHLVVVVDEPWFVETMLRRSHEKSASKRLNILYKRIYLYDVLIQLLSMLVRNKVRLEHDTTPNGEPKTKSLQII